MNSRIQAIIGAPILAACLSFGLHHDEVGEAGGYLEPPDWRPVSDLIRGRRPHRGPQRLAHLRPPA